jgi:hypothetical protein
LAIPPEGNGKKFKKSILKFEKMGNEKNWNMPQKFENFHFEMNISVWNWKKMAISPEGNANKIEMKKVYISFMPLR